LRDARPSRLILLRLAEDDTSVTGRSDNRTRGGRVEHRAVLGAGLALFALCLRLAWPAPMPVAAAADWRAATGFDEHLLCLAAPANDAVPPAAPHGNSPAAPDHAGHDGLGCCPWHGAFAFALPTPAPAAPVRYDTISAPRLAGPPPVHPVRLAGIFRVRGPPGEA
jgi:hypothetical protein